MGKPITLILAFTLLTVAGCGSREDSREETPRQEVSEAAPETVIGLHTAAATGDMDAIRRHIEAGSDLNVRDPEGGACPLSTAALFGQTEAAKALIDAGADINCRGNDGATPLHVAAFFCRTEIVKALLDKGADKTIKNSYGSTPLETVSGPFESVEQVYDHFRKTLGLELDDEVLKETRPAIAEMLR